jgi:hypothetical protein
MHLCGGVPPNVGQFNVIFESVLSYVQMDFELRMLLKAGYLCVCSRVVVACRWPALQPGVLDPNALRSLSLGPLCKLVPPALVVSLNPAHKFVGNTSKPTAHIDRILPQLSRIMCASSGATVL